MQAIAETYEYLRECKRLGVSDSEQNAIKAVLAANPKAGDEIPGAGGARKLRVAGRGKGKSGGYRVVTFYGGDDIPLFLLTIYGKGDKANLSQAERNALAQGLPQLSATYRQGVKHNVEGR
jgi:hypothetical protein